MQITGMLYGSELLKYAGFPTSEVLGPGATEAEIRSLIDRHGGIIIKPIFKGGGKKGKAGLIGFASDLKTALREKERLYFAELQSGEFTFKANGVTFEGLVPAEHEVYFSITDTTRFRAPTMTLTHRGGVDVEEVDKQFVTQIPFDPLTGLKAFVVANALSALQAPKEIISPLVQTLPKLWELYHNYGMTTLEVNPIRMRPEREGRLTPVACDFRCGFDRDDTRWQRLGLPADLFAFDYSDFEQEINQLRTYQGQSDVYVINPLGTILAPTFGGGANSLVSEILGDLGIISSDFGGNPPYAKMNEVAQICFKHWLKQTNVLFIVGGKANNTDIYETFRAMSDALRDFFSRNGPTPLFIVAVRGGPNLIRGMGALRETAEALGLPYRIFGFDSDISEVINYAKTVDAWMRAGGRTAIAQKLRIPSPRDGLSIMNKVISTSSSARQRAGGFPYFVGITSLDQVAAREDRVCVLNVLGSESRDVTPVGHVYSGGNVVFGTSPGRSGQSLKTALGDIPVYNDVREGLEAGHGFNCGVVYLPPAGARDGVAELIRVNPELRKIFIVTEKLSVHDSREIRAMAQSNGIDVFGGNSLGVADAWNQVRIGGALGGNNPAEALRAGSVSIFSNSGNFTTTMATYLRMAGWGTTTLISSGKDVYIHFAAPEFAFALGNDPRTKAAVLYVEPGGHYERDAVFTKPIIACVVGRWKSKLTRPVGHAGAMSGGDDHAMAKERWFMEKVGVDAVFTRERPVFSERGAVVTNIAHITHALTAVMKANGCSPDFDPEGSLHLKPWFGSAAGLSLPPELDLPVVQAMPPYGAEIERLNRQLGAVFPRQPMKDTSGALQMDSVTQVTTLHGTSMLEAAQFPLEANIALALLRQTGTAQDWGLISAAVGCHVNLHNSATLVAAQAAREAGNAPNAVITAALSIAGPLKTERARQVVRTLLEAFANAGPTGGDAVVVNAVRIDDVSLALMTAGRPDARANTLLAGVAARGASTPFLKWLSSLSAQPTWDGALACVAALLAWEPLMRRRISLQTAESLPWWLQLFGVAIGASADAAQHTETHFAGLSNDAIAGSLSLNEIACTALTGRRAEPDALFAFQTLVGLLLSNGPGTISAQGAKGAVSADGPESPQRVQLNKALIGGLTHTGFAHGGNGYEGIAFLLDQFATIEIADPGLRDHGIDLTRLALRYASEYAAYKAERKSVGTDMHKIPGVNHPVFKDKAVNWDPREVFVRELYERRGEYNIFHDYYNALVLALYDTGVSRNVFCVNVDAVIAALLLKLLWQPYQSGEFSKEALETAAFTVFLYARMIGCAAEIDDHLNRGRNMDTRTPASSCVFVS